MGLVTNWAYNINSFLSGGWALVSAYHADSVQLTNSEVLHIYTLMLNVPAFQFDHTSNAFFYWENVSNHKIVVCIHDHSSDIQECLEICCQQLSHLYKQGLTKGFHSEMIRVVFWLVSWYMLCGNIYESPLSLALSAMSCYISTSLNRLLLLVAWRQLFLLHLPYKSDKCFSKKYLQVCSTPFLCVGNSNFTFKYRHLEKIFVNLVASKTS